MDDKKIIQLIRKGAHQKALGRLYENFPQVKAFILKEGGTAQQAEDIFQDALVICLKKWSQPEFELTSSLTTYIYGVAKFTWRNEARKRTPQMAGDLVDGFVEDEVNDFLIEEKKYEALDQMLMTIGEKCSKILKWFYFEKMSMKDIAQKLDFQSEKSAKTQKYKCMEKAKGLAVSFLKH